MAMGLRNLDFWVREAKRKMLRRRIEQFNAALLPHMGQSGIREARNAIILEAQALDDETRQSLIDEVERISAKKIEETERRRKARRAAKSNRLDAPHQRSRRF